MKIAATVLVVLMVAVMFWFVGQKRRTKRISERLRATPGATDSLRMQVLTGTAEDLGIVLPEPGDTTWGVVADIGLKGGAATVVALRDGNASLYVGPSSGVIGGVGHDAVRDAAMAAVREAADAVTLPAFEPGKPGPLPGENVVRIYVLTTGGLRETPEIPVALLLEKNHPLAPLFFRINDVITQLRLVAGRGGGE